MNHFTIDKEPYSIASKWSELTAEQVLTLARWFGKSQAYHRIKIEFAFYLLGLKVMIRKPIDTLDGYLYYVTSNRKKIHLLSTASVAAVARQVDWLFRTYNTATGDSISLNPLLINNPVRDIKIRFCTLRGPDDGLGNITFREFIFAETFLHRYHTTQQPAWLAKFMATLWHPMRFGIAQPFRQEKVDQWSKRTLRIKPHVAMAIGWYYQGSKEFLMRKYPHVFSVGGGKSTDPFESYMHLTATLARSNPTQMEQVRDANIHDTLVSLEQMIKDSKPKRK